MTTKLQKLVFPALLAALCTGVSAQNDWQSRKDAKRDHQRFEHHPR